MFVVKRNYFFIDVLKLLLAILIVMLHSNIFPNSDDNSFGSFLHKYIYVLVLPLFFSFSGFFFHNHTIASFPWKKIKRVILLYLFWVIPNSPTIYIKYNAVPFGHILSGILFSGTFMTSWFLNAIIWCMIIDSLLSYLSPKVSFIGSGCVAIVSFLISNGVLVLPESVSNFFWMPFCFIPYYQYFFIGRLCRMFSMNRTIVYISFVAILFAFLTSSLNHYMFWLLICSICLLLTQGLPFVENPIGVLFRKMSTIIYLSHPFVMISIKHLVGYMSYGVFLVVLVALFILSISIIKLEPKIPILKYAY